MKDKFSKEWILKNGIPIVESYSGNITLRALHYRLVACGMKNDVKHYKKVVSAMTDARWEKALEFDAFVDHERALIGRTEFKETEVKTAADHAKEQIRAWATSYKKNMWENQPIYPEVFIEKKALQGVFEKPCDSFSVALSPCKGYPSLTFLYDAKKRFDYAIAVGKEPVILYFGDYDCSGEDIPRSIQETLSKMGTDVEVRRIALLKEQVIKWKLPPAPTKESDTRSHNWNGMGQVELDAVEPKAISNLCTAAIQSVFDDNLYSELNEEEEKEENEFKKILKRDFNKLLK